MKCSLSISFALLLAMTATAQEVSKSTLAAALPLGVPKPGPTNDAPYAPQPILQGGIVMPLYPADSALLKKDRVREAEQYNMSKAKSRE